MDCSYDPILRFLAHLRGELVSVLIVYPWSGVRPSVAIRRPQYSNIINETAWPIKATFCVGPLWLGGGGGGVENLFVASESYDLDGRHDHMW